MDDKEQKNIFSKNLLRLISERGKSQTEVAKDLGIALTTFNNWCTEVSIPKVSKLQELADYFGVVKSELVDEHRDNQYYINEDARDLAQFMYDNPEYKVLFDATRKVKKEDIEFVKQMLDRFKGE